MDTSIASIAVPGLDHSLPPVIAAPLSALDDPSPNRGVSHGMGGLLHGLRSPAPRAPVAHRTPVRDGRALKKRRRSRDVEPVLPGLRPHPSLTPSAEEARGMKKPRRYSYWTAAELRLLLEGACMAGADFERVSSIVGTRDASACRKQVRQIASRVRAKMALPPGGPKDECVATVLDHLQVARPAPPAPRMPRRPRGTPRALHKISIQAVPAGDEDAEIVSKAGRNPCVEVVLRAHRCVWDVIAHLYSKWGHPLQLVAPGSTAALCVDDSVAKLHAELGTPGAMNVVRVSYRFVRPRFDPNLLGNPGGKGGTGSRMRLKSGRRTYALPAPGRLFGEDEDEDEDELDDMDLGLSHDESPRAVGKKQRGDSRLISRLMDQIAGKHDRSRNAVSKTNTTQVESSSDKSTSVDERSIEQSGAHVMGKWKARLDSLQSVPALPRLGGSIPSPIAPSAITFASGGRGGASGLRATFPPRDESLALAASELAAETSSSPSKRRLGIADYPALSGSMFGNISMFKVDNAPASVELNRAPLGSLFGNLSSFKADAHTSVDLGRPSGPAPRTPLRERLLSSDNALDIHAATGDDSSQSPLPPRLSIGGAEPSLNFSLLFGDPLPSVGRAENSGLVP